ncbi:MAG TPA: hypothetical protein VGM02_01435 [Acidobacteriaceae bacterium]|jgi:hypothetical protein
MNMTAIISLLALIASYIGWQWRTHERTTTLGLQIRTCENKDEQHDERLSKIETEQRELRDAHIRQDATMAGVLADVAKMDGKLDRLIESRS